jgi:hypothetical protein
MLESYSGGFRFESWPEHRVSSPRLYVTSEIRTEYPPNSSLERYHYTTLLDPRIRNKYENLLLLRQEIEDGFLDASQAYEVALYRVQSL